MGVKRYLPETWSMGSRHLECSPLQALVLVTPLWAQIFWWHYPGYLLPVLSALSREMCGTPPLGTPQGHFAGLGLL